MSSPGEPSPGNLMQRGWTRFRRLPLWAQLPIGFVVLSLVVAPFLPEESGDSDTATEQAQSPAASPIDTSTPMPSPDPAPLAPTPSPTTSTTPSPSPVPAASPKQDEGQLCEDPAGDQEGGGQPGDLRSVELRRQDDQLAVTFLNSAAPPTQGTVGWFLMASSADGESAKQLGARWNNGQPEGYFVFDVGDAKQEDLQGQFEVDGARMTALFPWAAIAQLGEGARWSAAMSIASADTDDCPDEGEDFLNPARLTFPPSWF